MDDVAPPPPDLDVVAARAAASLFLRLVAAGSTRPAAWAAAVGLFRQHHPGWSAALLEQESVRTLAAMIHAMEPPAEPQGTPAPAFTLLQRLRHGCAAFVLSLKLAWRGPVEAG
ncbi:hypothetical protein [Roseomonas elaeocarpi]|uniref:Uncharacterized protein n=1 Tax=Roseomonas elaeocarpi TaxID=907779 RepID=A0ABV6JWZ3_9PROT